MYPAAILRPSATNAFENHCWEEDTRFPMDSDLDTLGSKVDPWRGEREEAEQQKEKDESEVI